MDPSRRLFLRGAQPAVVTPPRPPWALRPERAFTERCTRCGDCVRACPHALLSAGDGGYPQIAFTRQGCTLCGDCRRACPSGALDPQATDAFTARVSVARHCLAERGVECRVCAEACDARALRFRPQPGGVWRLQVDLGACTGCGACVAPCPVGAITLRERSQGAVAG
ncbi:ferredoxin-type protein NapF [Ideonella sp. 4Y11]|uniref:Ferredoxin-type protein NapF n=1 Tax=Ideonella aquatica TaxID=2824119 RepID=A0A940YPE5_9BURK|nr:ferredoxin-type protein NapF [Ideonella aquatica]MBQ0961594.1 ferredoxin-type protein NapF [Ideonella aquatica]